MDEQQHGHLATTLQRSDSIHNKIQPTDTQTQLHGRFPIRFLREDRSSQTAAVQLTEWQNLLTVLSTPCHKNMTATSRTHTSSLKKIRIITVPTDAFLFFMDVDSLYANIDTTLGLRAIGEIFRKYPGDRRPDEALLSLLQINLKRNDFEFGSSCFLHIHGTAMDKKIHKIFANIYMANCEETALRKCPKLPTLYLRYLHDIFGVWEHSEEDFLLFCRDPE